MNPQSSDTFDQLVRDLESEEDLRVSDALWKLGAFDDERIPEILARKLSEGNANSKRYACHAINHRHSILGQRIMNEQDYYIDPLISIAVDELEPIVRANGFLTLRLFRDDRVSDLVIRCSALENDALNRGGLVWILKEIGGKRAIEAIIDRLQEDHPNVRAMAVQALAEIGDPEGLLSIIDVLDDGASILPLRETQVVIPISVGEIAQASFQKLGSRAVEPLLHVLDHPREQIRVAVAMILGSIHDERAISALIRLTHDKSLLVHEAAKNALSALGYP